MPEGKDKDSDENAGGNTPKRAKDDPYGRALKTVYDDTLREDIPSDLEDLLRKLK